MAAEQPQSPSAGKVGDAIPENHDSALSDSGRHTAEEHTAATVEHPDAAPKSKSRAASPAASTNENSHESLTANGGQPDPTPPKLTEDVDMIDVASATQDCHVQASTSLGTEAEVGTGPGTAAQSNEECTESAPKPSTETPGPGCADSSVAEKPSSADTAAAAAAAAVNSNSEPAPVDMDINVDTAKEGSGPASSTGHVDMTEGTSHAEAGPSAQDVGEAADIAKLDIRASSDKSPPQDTTMSEAVAVPSVAGSSRVHTPKISREREDDVEDAPLAKRLRTETVEDTIGVNVGLSPAPTSAVETVADTVPNDAPITVYQNKQIRGNLATVKKTKNGGYFKQSVQRLWPGLWADYSAKISTPVDLTLFETKLRNDEYRSFGDFKADVRLLYDNALTFNGPMNPITEAARLVQERILTFLQDVVTLVEPPKVVKSKTQPTRHAETRAVTLPPRRASNPAPKQDAAASPKAKKDQPEVAAAASGTAPPTPASSTGPAFAVAQNGVPQIRRDSTRDDGDRPKRPIHPPKNRDPDYSTHLGRKKKLSPELKFYSGVLDEIRKPKYQVENHWFAAPVDPVALQLPTYNSIVKKPMDLSTMAEKMENGDYKSGKEVEKDMHQIVVNSALFNGEVSEVTNTARQLERLFQGKAAEKDKWMAKNAPVSTSYAAASPEPLDSDQESEAGPEEQDNENIRALQTRVNEEQEKLNVLLGSKTPSPSMIEIQQTVLSMLQRSLVEERIKFSATAKKAKSKKSSKSKSKIASSGNATSGKRFSGGSIKPTNNGKATSGGKKGAPKKRPMTQMERNIIAEGINALDGPLLHKAVDIIKRDTNQKEDAEGQLELDIDVLSHTALVKLYDIVVMDNPGIVEEVSAKPQYQEQAAEQQVKDKTAAASGPKPRKNKPMNKHEQEEKIRKLRDLKAQFQHQNTDGQEVSPPDDDAQPQADTSEEDSDSEEE